MEEALRLKLLAANGIAGVVTSIAWDESPQGAVEPRLVLSLISRGHGYTHDGHDGLDESRVRIDIFTASVPQKWALSKAAITAMEAQGTQGAWLFGPGFLDAERDFEPVDMGGGRKVQRRSQDWLLMNQAVA